MCLLKSKFWCDFNETVFKDTVFRRCLLQYANLDRRAATGDFGRNPADGFRIEQMQVQGNLQLRAADLTGTNCFKTYFSGTDLWIRKSGE